MNQVLLNQGQIKTGYAAGDNRFFYLKPASRVSLEFQCFRQIFCNQFRVIRFEFFPNRWGWIF